MWTPHEHLIWKKNSKFKGNFFKPFFFLYPLPTLWIFRSCHPVSLTPEGSSPCFLWTDASVLKEINNWLLSHPPQQTSDRTAKLYTKAVLSQMCHRYWERMNMCIRAARALIKPPHKFKNHLKEWDNFVQQTIQLVTRSGARCSCLSL